MKRPLIAVTPGCDSNGMAYVYKGYYEGIHAAGGLAMLITLSTDEEILLEALERCDGILATGGPDPDPRYYGEPNMPCNGEISPVRDSLELFLIKKALELDKPVLGICRGIQVINVAMGGTLYQDIVSQFDGEFRLKHAQQAPGWYPTHEIALEKGSRVWESFGGRDTVRVNSFHHQAVKDVAPGFKATAKAQDGLVEAIERQGGGFAVGVQWHPEHMWSKDEMYLNLFKDFVKNCRGNA